MMQPPKQWRHSSWIFGGLVAAILALLVAAAKTSTIPLWERHKRMCDGMTLSRKHENALQKIMQASGEATVLMSTSAQHGAACWTLRDGKGKFDLQRYVLAVLYYGTKGVNWDLNDDWMTQKHVCSWFGVICDNAVFKNIIELDLGYIKVDGMVPRELGLLSNLRELDLHGNDLQGVIPMKLLVGLKKLKVLRLQMNGFFGALHKEVFNMVNLEQLNLFGNYIAGTIPTELATLKKLTDIDLYANQLEGTIPKELAKLPNLKFLDVHDNNLVGSMPQEICAKKLDILVADCLGRNPEVRCDCCTHCCKGLPEMMCVDMKTGQKMEFIVPSQKKKKK